MTRNQIEYQKLLETKRANVANESLTHRRDEGTLALRGAELLETGRHNRAFELETSTHNRNVEAETARHNLRTEEQGMIDLGIKSRHATVAERNATVNERNAATNASQAAARWYDVATGRMAHFENQRHNFAQEGLQSEANSIRQQEADTKQQEADTNAERADAAIAFDLARAETEAARKGNLEKETQYMGQENARAWIGTIGTQIHNFRQDNANAVSSVAKLFPVMSSLLGG